MKDNKIVYVPVDDEQVKQEYLEKLNTDPEFSLEVDPTNKYSLSQEHKDFIKQFLEYNNIPIVCELLHIEEGKARKYLLQTETQNEINRIKKARYHRQFANKLVDVDQIGGYLTSLLTDDNVPVYEQLSMKQKLKVAELLIKVNSMKNTGINNPSDFIDTKPVIEQVKDMSSKDIKKLIDKSQDKKINLERELIIIQLTKNNNLTEEDIEYLKTLPIEELKKLQQGGQ